MSLLAIELSSGEKSVALQTSDGTMHERRWSEDRSRPDPLYEELDGLRADAGLTWEDITGVVVGRGPGQYSGMRAAVSAAQGLAIPGGIPVMGVSSGAALAWRVLQSSDDTVVAVLGDARRDRWWMGLFCLEQNALHRLSDWSLCTDKELVATVNEAGACIVTSDWDRSRERLEDLLPTLGRLHSGALTPTASDLLRLHAQRSGRGDVPESPLPIYLHPAVAAK